MSGITLQNQPVRPEVFISNHLTEEVIGICVDALPHKAFDLVGGDDVYHPKSLYPCRANLHLAAGFMNIRSS
jgi:hypothetical protein